MPVSFPSTGMITTSPTNPLDEIPIGPQTFPFGTPTIGKSNVEPYISTNYKNNNSSTIIKSTQVYPATNYQNVLSTYSNKYQTNEEYPVTNYQASTIKHEYTDMAVYPSIKYEKVITPKYEEIPKNTYYLGETSKYQAVSTPILTTSYQTITSYKPVVKTVLVPRITTSYIPNPYGNLVETRVVNPPISTPEPQAQRPLYSPETVPLPAPVLAPFVPLGPPPAPKPAPTISPMQIQVQDDSHYISNFPIYETDPKRSEYYIKRNQSILNSMNLGSQVITSHYPTNSITGNIVGTDLGINNGLNTGLNSGMNTYYNTGLSEENTGINTINLSGLNTGVNNLGTDINTNGTNYLNSAGNATSTTDNIASGLNNFSNQVGDFATNEVNNTEEGLNNNTSEVKGLFD
jgi:hypothetical protein